jgi:hypothetical protein
MDLLFGLATVDKMHGDRLARQLANGWMSRESKLWRQLRMLGAKILLALATRLTPADLRPAGTQQPLTGSAGT